MARYTHARNTFQFGEVSPASYGRADLKQYREMCEEIKNNIPKTSGGVTRRPGFKFLPETYSLATINDLSAVGTIKLIPFNTTYDKQGFLILALNNIYRYSVNSLPYGGGLSHIGAVGLLGAVLYGTGNSWHVANSGEGYIEGIEQWAQFGDLIVICNGIQEPLFVVGLSAGSESYFLLTEGKFIPSLGTLDSGISSLNMHTFYPWDAVNGTATTFTLSLATVGTGRTLTASAATFTAAMVGRRIRGVEGGVNGFARITGYTNSTTVTVTVFQAFNDTTMGTSWAFSQWGGDRGWPRACAFYKERLVFAGNTAYPDGIWLSQIGDLYEFSQQVPTDALVASDAYNLQVGQSSSAFINHLFPKENLFANMEIKESYLAPIDSTASIGALNTEVASHSQYGAAQTQPYGLHESLIYAGWPENVTGSYYGRKLLEIIFNPKDSRYDVTELSQWTPDITRDRCRGASAITTRPQFMRIAVTKKPTPMIWALDTTGKLYSVTRDVKTGVMAWAHHVLGGTYSSDEPKVLDIIDCAGQLVLTVLRNTGGNADQICYEILSEEFVSAELDNSAIYLDYAITGTVSAGSISGLTHLNGNTVHAVVGGVYLGTYTVSGNAISVGTAYNGQTTIVGYNYESLLTLSALESNALFGSGLGQMKRTEEATVLFERTVAAKVGVIGLESVEEEIQFRASSVPADDPIPLFTGEKIIKLPADYETRQNVYIKQDKPYPMTINAIICKGILYD